MRSHFTAMITGSFDPITEGHMDIIERAAKLFDTVYVVMFINVDKKYMFTEQERLCFIEKACADIPNVKVDFSKGMVIDYVKEHGISAIIRGIRGDEDIAYEKLMAEFNYKNSGVETLLLPAKPKYENFSSTLARSILQKGEKLDGLLPKSIIDDVIGKFSK